jgi:putative hydrolase of the HAD superfamily
MVIVFDLDDTLFDELTYAYGGLRAAAEFLSPIIGKDATKIASALNLELAEKREQVFDRYLLKQGIINKELVKRCINVYRAHPPQISLYPEAKMCLERLLKHPLYIVTDGNKIVQRKKFDALGLGKWIKKCLCTNAYGINHSKPSPYCFQKICSLEKTDPSNVVYVADNPNKDFIGIKPLGFHTIRVMTGRFRELKLSDIYNAETRINNLSELDDALLSRLKNRSPHASHL